MARALIGYQRIASSQPTASHRENLVYQRVRAAQLFGGPAPQGVPEVPETLLGGLARVLVEVLDDEVDSETHKLISALPEKDPEVRWVKGQVLLHQGQCERALEEFEAALEADPRPSYRVAAAEAALASARWSDAARHTDALESDAAEILWLTATRLALDPAASRADREQVLAQLDRADEAAYPERIAREMQLARAHLLYMLGRGHDFDAAAKGLAEGPRAWRLASLRYAAGGIDEAGALLEGMRSPRAQLLLAEILAERGQWQRAEDLLATDVLAASTRAQWLQRWIRAERRLEGKPVENSAERADGDALDDLLVRALEKSAADPAEAVEVLAPAIATSLERSRTQGRPLFTDELRAGLGHARILGIAGDAAKGVATTKKISKAMAVGSELARYADSVRGRILAVRAELYWRLGDWDKARATFARALKAWKSVRVAVAKARFETAAGRDDAAREAVTLLVESWPDDLRVQITALEVALRLPLVEQANRLVARLAELAAGKGPAIELSPYRARLALVQHAPEVAAEQAAVAIERGSDPAEAHVVAVLAALQVARIAPVKEAIAAAGKALKGTPWMGYFRGRAASLEEDLRVAKTELEQACAAIEASHQSLRWEAQCWSALAFVAYQNEDPERALSLVERALNRHSRCAEAYFVRGVVYSGQDLWEKAFSAFSRSIDVDPYRPAAWFLAGEAAYRAGDHGAAKTLLEHYLTLAPKGEFAPDARDLLK